MTATSSGTPWLRYSCLGCLGLFAFLLMAGGGIFGLAWYQSGQIEMSDTVATPRLPEAGRPAAPLAGLDAGEITGPGLQTGTAASPALPLGSAPVGRVRLDLSHARFEVVPGQEGEPLHVEAHYDKSAYELEESLQTEDTADDQGRPAWTYTVKFRRARGGGFLAALREMISGKRPTVRIVLPPDVPLALNTNLQQGETMMDLGGLWLREADLKFAQGGFELRVPERLREPMESLRIDGSMGGGMISNLGNASPRRLDLDFSMGGLVLDLNGAWAADADIDITASMGGTVVRLPRNVIMEGVPVEGLRPDPGAEIQPPTLRFTTSSSMGEMEFQR